MMEKTIYDFTVKDNHNNDHQLAQYKNKVLLLVNTASKCGFTPQFEGLEALYEKYKDQGLVIIGFPCNQFASQDPGTDAEIASFCQLNYGVSFPIMKKVDVNGENTAPVYKFLKSKAKGFLISRIKWNFTKFLVAPDGKSVKRYSPATKPGSIEADIVKLLNQN